jgi:ABC-2 type transport system ATP-binding protein
MKNTIELNNVSKSIDGNEVLQNINLRLESGKIYGFIGKNGSGKTMLFRVIAGLIRAGSGSLSINGNEYIYNSKYPLTMGIIIENAGMYKEFTGRDNLKFLASIRKTIGEQEIDEAITKVGLDPKDKRTIKKYSLGMRQRIIFAQAIMEKPDLLLLDEPTNALDKDGVELIRQLILEEKNRGAIVCLASHNEEDISTLCDEIYRMEFGKIRGMSE